MCFGLRWVIARVLTNWRGSQVIEHKLTATEKDSIKQELEATVGLQLDHPNVVHTYKHVTRVMSSVRRLLKLLRLSQQGCWWVMNHNSPSVTKRLIRRNNQPGSAGTLIGCRATCCGRGAFNHEMPAAAAAGCHQCG